MMRTVWPGDTFGDMEAVRRVAGSNPGIIVDAGIGIAGAALVAIAAWGSPRLIGSTAIVGPEWLRALLPLLVGAALVLRRRAPLLMWLAIWVGLALLYLLADNSMRRPPAPRRNMKASSTWAPLRCRYTSACSHSGQPNRHRAWSMRCEPRS